MSDKCVLLFSGGTDSFCSAALLAELFSEIHLVTYHERATATSNIPGDNVKKLRQKFPQVNFLHFFISTDRLIKNLSYESYFKNIFKFGFYNLSTPGISSLSWHLRTIMYCRENQISHVYDGMTKELVHLPGHHPQIRMLFFNLYKEFGIRFSSPVIDWDVPPDQRYVDRLIVDRHGFSKSDELVKEKTTGAHLYKLGLLPHPNVKGSLFDQKMQHDCYPFVLYNIFVFWWAYPMHGEAKHNNFLRLFMESKIEYSKRLLQRNVYEIFESQAELH